MKSGSDPIYGSVRPLIEALIDFEQELELNRHSLDFDLGLIMEQGRGLRYMSTPPDVIPFAHAGVDGIHYGFLTDFGLHTDLSQAPIVCVSPVDWNGVWLVAHHLQDFLSVVYTDSSPLIRNFKSVEEYTAQMAQGSGEVKDERKMLVRELFKNRFSIQPIEDMAQYMGSLFEARKQGSAVPTMNGLGIPSVTASSASSCVHTPFRVTDSFNWELEGDAVRELFRTGSRESKLAFIRDAQTCHLFTNSILRGFITTQLKLMGMVEAADHLEESYYTVIPDVMEL